MSNSSIDIEYGKRRSASIGRLRALIGAPAVALLLTACGGGGHSAADNTGPGGPTPTSYRVGGAVTGLSGSGLAITDNGGDRLTISASGAFTFATALSAGASYAVAVSSQPARSCGRSASSFMRINVGRETKRIGRLS